MNKGIIKLFLILFGCLINLYSQAVSPGSHSHRSSGAHHSIGTHSSSTSHYSWGGSHSSSHHSSSHVSTGGHSAYSHSSGHVSTGSHRTSHSSYLSTSSHRKTYSSGATRNSHGKIRRSSRARHDFMKQTGYPHGRKGYVIDHIIPLKKGGCDCPSNMQWQSIQDAKAKDKWESP